MASGSWPPWVCPGEDGRGGPRHRQTGRSRTPKPGSKVSQDPRQAPFTSSPGARSVQLPRSRAHRPGPWCSQAAPTEPGRSLVRLPPGSRHLFDGPSRQGPPDVGPGPSSPADAPRSALLSGHSGLSLAEERCTGSGSGFRASPTSFSATRATAGKPGLNVAGANASSPPRPPHAARRASGRRRRRGGLAA